MSGQSRPASTAARSGHAWPHKVGLDVNRSKRAKADQIGHGTPASHRLRLGELVDLPAELSGMVAPEHSQRLTTRTPM